MSDSKENYMNTQKMLQNIMYQAIEKEHDNGGDIIEFMTDALGGLMASEFFNTLEWDSPEDLTDERKVEILLELTLDRFTSVMSSLVGTNSDVEIVVHPLSETKYID